MAHNGGSQQPTGAVFGRYTLVRKLGTGGMAEVYLARVAGEAGFQRDVALKIMHPNLASMPEVVDHFLDEARLASRLSHPNIVQIYDLGRSGEDYYIAMEYIDGYDLDFLLDSGSARGAPIPVRVTLAIVRKVCDGLHAAHTAVTAEGAPLDLVHRDVKAENVLISRKGEVKVADFGIAKANQRVRQTQLGMVKGTAAYMAPEHRVGKPVDRRADVYGVGAILYELLTGTQINLDLENLAHLGKEGWPHLTPPSQVRGDLPQEIDALVFKALAFDREDRYPTCAAMEDALEQFAVRHALEVGDKIVVAWIEKEIAFAEARAAQGGAAS
jgi:serine/threonine-protein kinase